MKAILKLAMPGLAVAVSLALFGCQQSQDGSGGGCGAPPPEASSRVTCGRGTHQEGNTCVRNASSTDTSGGSSSAGQPANEPVPTQ